MKTRSLSNLERMLDADAGKATLLPLLDLTDYRQLSLVNHSRHRFFNTPAVLSRTLAYHFAQIPNEERTKAILKRNLDLLIFEFKQIKLPKYTLANGTALQCAWGAGDFEMCIRVLKPLFVTRYGKKRGMEEMQRQIGEVQNAHTKFDFEHILNAIKNEPFNNGRDKQGRWILSDDTLSAIKKFRDDFDSNQLKIIDKGIQFNWEMLHELCQASHAFMRDNKRGALVQDAIFAWVLPYVPQNDKQRFIQGLDFFMPDKPESFTRTKKNHPNVDTFDMLLSMDSMDFVLNGYLPDIVYGGLQCRGPGNGEFSTAEFLRDPVYIYTTILTLSIFADYKLRAFKTALQPKKSKTYSCAIL